MTNHITSQDNPQDEPNNVTIFSRRQTIQAAVLNNPGRQATVRGGNYHLMPQRAVVCGQLAVFRHPEWNNGHCVVHVKSGWLLEDNLWYRSAYRITELLARFDFDAFWNELKLNPKHRPAWVDDAKHVINEVRNNASTHPAVTKELAAWLDSKYPGGAE